MIITITDMKIKSYSNIFIIIILSLAVYLNTFQSPFHFDDEFALIGNIDLRSWEAINKYHFISRYILFLSFHINYIIGEFNVIGYHVVNFLLHILVSILVYLITDFTIKQDESQNYSSLKNIPLLSALIFTAHPINTESVTYIISRSSIMATLFYLLSLFFFIKGYAIDKTQYAVTKRSIFYLSSIASFVLAIGTKEDTVTLPIIILLYLFYFLYKGKGIVNFTREYRVYILAPLILLTSYLLYRFYILGSGAVMTMSADLLKYITPWYYFLTELKVIVFYYLKLLLFPMSLNVDPDIIMSTSVLEPAVVFSAILILFFLYLSYRLYHISKLLSFSILWFLITLIPTSSVVPLLDFAAEHRLYLPAVGLSIGFADLLNRVNRHAIRNIIITVVLLFFSIGTVKRNITWNDSIGLWLDAVKKSPYKARAYYNLGIEYAQEKQFEKALIEFKRSVKILPTHLLSHLMAGKMYKELGIYKNIIDEMGVVLSLKPEKIDDHVDAYLELSSAYIKLGNFVKAEESIKEGLKLNQKNVMLHNNMATIMAERGLFDEAVKELRTALRIKPDYLKAYYNIGLIYEKRGFVNDAIKEFEKAINIEPNNSESYLFLGELYKRSGFPDKAVYNYEMSIKYDSDKERAKRTEMIIKEIGG
jgi:tetratricopeptide (TPR) repeat protein